MLGQNLGIGERGSLEFVSKIRTCYNIILPRLMILKFSFLNSTYLFLISFIFANYTEYIYFINISNINK